MLRKRTLILAAAAGAAVAGTAVADTKTMHGAGCAGNDDTGFTRSGVGLTAGSAGTVYCPLTRERNNSAAGIAAVHVELFNAAAGAISCTLSTQREDVASSQTTAATVYASHTLSSTVTAVGNVDVKPLKTATINGNEGSYMVSCDLAAGDILYHVYLNETNSLD